MAPKLTDSAAPGKTSAPPSTPRPIRFADEEWADIAFAARQLSERLHLEVTPAEWVRMAARKQLEQEAA